MQAAGRRAPHHIYGKTKHHVVNSNHCAEPLSAPEPAPTVIPPGIKVKDFAYHSDGGVKGPNPPISDDHAPMAMRAQAYAKKMAKVQATEARNAEKLKKAQAAYRQGHHERPKGESRRRERSADYERRGDRLRKESPEAKAEEREEKRTASAHRTRLRVKRASSGGGFAAGSHRDRLDSFRNSRDVRGRTTSREDEKSRGRSGSSPEFRRNRSGRKMHLQKRSSSGSDDRRSRSPKLRKKNEDTEDEHDSDKENKQPNIKGKGKCARRQVISLFIFVACG